MGFRHRKKSNSMLTSRGVGLLKPCKCALLLCDMQERFRPLINKGETVVNTCKLMTSVCKELNIPIVVTEQYSNVFGATIKDCFVDEEHAKSVPTFEKRIFSMMTPEVSEHLSTMPDVDSFLLVGVEAHVCVQQTALELLDLGRSVHVIVDGVSSQQEFDSKVAVQRMRDSGAFITTAQAAIFMLMNSSEHPNFKPISKLVVDHMKQYNEFNA